MSVRGLTILWFVVQIARITAQTLRGGRFLRGLREPTYSLWRKGESGWRRIDLEEEPKPIQSGIQFYLTVDEGLHLFGIHSENTTQFLSLPAERSIVAVRWRRVGPHIYSRADARTADRGVESLRGYMQRGEFDTARVVAPEVMAERFLRDKRSAPRVAALGAYFLLRVGDLKRLHNWPDNLTDWKTWLPDGPVIAAWQRLRSKDPNYEEIYELFREAVRRGLPVYTEGVRLLKDGLDLFGSDDERDWHVTEMQKEVERYAKAMIWDKSETTFFGDNPDQPRATMSPADFTIPLSRKTAGSRGG